jgi:hypothetical protein
MLNYEDLIELEANTDEAIAILTETDWWVF